MSIEGVQRQYSMDVTGILDFEYILDSHQKMNEIKLNNMLLQGTSSLSTDVGTFSDIIISSVGRVSAACDAVKSVPATYTPCDWYNIPAGDMAISVSAQQDNGRIFMISQSVQPIPINIDQKARTFDLKGGPIMGKINVNGEDKTVGITINVTGHFLNFAPIADASESQKGAECVEKQNGSNIGLYASMSKEIYGDVLPTNPDNYLWFEDFGLVTEKLLGKGRSFPIPPGTLTYGVHYLTLLLYDDHGVSDIDKFKVEVRDTKPPDLTIPGDINLLLRTKKFPVHVDIGKASAFDVCSETDVAIINNSPADGMFPKGDNPVTWTAHDGHGNTTSKIQHVNILTYDKFSRMDVLRGIREGSDRVKSALSENKAKIKECRDIKNCGTNLDSLLSFNKQMITAAGEMPATGKQVRSKRQLIELLEAAGSSLGQANGLLKGKAGRGRGEAEIRSEVMNKLRKAGELMDEVSRRTQPRG